VEEDDLYVKVKQSLLENHETKAWDGVYLSGSRRAAYTYAVNRELNLNCVLLEGSLYLR